MHRRRRRVALLVAVLALLGLLAVGVRAVVHDLGFFDVEDVQVMGTTAVAADDVLAAAAVEPGGPLASIDTDAIASRVAQLPGIRAVEVGRSWPHTVVVTVTERIPIAMVGTPQGLAPVDAGGVVYPGPVTPGLPRLTFPAGPDDPATRTALYVLGALPEPLRDQVLTVDTATGGGTVQVSLGLTEERLVRWGTAEQAGEKASVLLPLLTQEGRVYDVTSPQLPTVGS